MATFLDIGLFENFGVIFVILLVFLLVFGLLEYMKAFGEDKRGLHGIIAFSVALLFLVSKTATAMVKMMVPWFMVIVIFIFFTLFLVRIFGVDEGQMKKLIGHKDVYPWIIIFVVLILFLSLGNALGQGLLEKGGGEQQVTNYSSQLPDASVPPSVATTTSTTTPKFTINLLNTLRHPKVLGMLFVALVGVFSLLFLTKMSKPT